MATKKARIGWAESPADAFREEDEEERQSGFEQILSGVIKHHSSREGWLLFPAREAPGITFLGEAVDLSERSSRRETAPRVPSFRSTGGLVIAGEPGRRHLRSLTVDDVKREAAQLLEDASAIRSLWAGRDDHALHLYAVVTSWDLEDLRPVYEKEQTLRERFPELELEFELLLEDERAWIPDVAELLLLRS